ncbi:hypothetical protein [Oceanobacillus arenosus]|uniref:hypothetical protein n=1 Tax=Oceanobacillus arenosus TaxID=1229153 RepID=UPI0014738F03|nr:hypothetical protein [Oceanobacillus arenosus]
MKMWHIMDKEGNTLAFLFVDWKVADYEKELRDKGVEYKTDFYIDNKLITVRN